VALNLSDEVEILATATRLLARARDVFPQARISGLLVQEMVNGLVELLVGTTCEVGFAPLIVIGAGGTLVDVMRDRSARIAPLDRMDAAEMLNELRILPLLQGYRGNPRADVEAVIDAVVGLAEFSMAARSWLLEAEVNPLVVLPLGRGVRAVDALIRVRHAEEA
jgi:acetyltransferase